MSDWKILGPLWVLLGPAFWIERKLASLRDILRARK